jgi:hypothetical protein
MESARKGIEGAGRNELRDQNDCRRPQPEKLQIQLQKFMQMRGSNAIISQGRRHKAQNAKFFASIERKYGVPAGSAACHSRHGDRFRPFHGQCQCHVGHRDACL